MAKFLVEVEAYEVGKPLPAWLETPEARKWVRPQYRSVGNTQSFEGYQTKTGLATKGDLILQDFTHTTDSDAYVLEEAVIKTVADVDVLTYKPVGAGSLEAPYRIEVTVPNSVEAITAADIVLTHGETKSQDGNDAVGCYSNAAFTIPAASTALTAGTPAVIYVAVNSYYDFSYNYYKVTVTRAKV